MWLVFALVISGLADTSRASLRRGGDVRSLLGSLRSLMNDVGGGVGGDAMRIAALWMCGCRVFFI